MVPAPVLVPAALSGGASAAFHGVAAALIAETMAEAVVRPGLMRTVRTLDCSSQEALAVVSATDASPRIRTREPFNCDAVARFAALEVRTKLLLLPLGVSVTLALAEPLTPPPATSPVSPPSSIQTVRTEGSRSKTRSISVSKRSMASCNDSAEPLPATASNNSASRWA